MTGKRVLIAVATAAIAAGVQLIWVRLFCDDAE
jgi:hypothetical protein